LTYPNGLTSTKNYGANSWISSITHSTGSFGINFSFDENGNITGIAEDGLLGPKSNNYVYDGENRLNSVTGSNPEVFNMDILGNILNGNAVFNNRNQLTENAEWFFEYDLNGNLSKKSAKLSPKVLEYDFDLENRLKQVRIFDNGTVLSTRLSYRYDALGRRIERKVEGTQTKITQFVHDGQNVLLEQNQSGQLERTYIRGSGIDELYGVLEDINQNGTFAPGEAFYFRTDHLGSVREVVKSSGETKQSVTYSAYGEPVVTPAPGEVELNVSRLYTGRDYERETGDYYYRARWFNPALGQFLTPDPIGFRGKDWNLYRYVKSNPILYSDPSGLFSSGGTSARALCRQQVLDDYYISHQSGVKTCETSLATSMNYCDSLSDEPILDEVLNTLPPTDNPFYNEGQQNPRGY